MRIHKRLIDLRSSADVVKQIVSRASKSQGILQLQYANTLDNVFVAHRPPSPSNLESMLRLPWLETLKLVSSHLSQPRKRISTGNFRVDAGWVEGFALCRWEGLVEIFFDVDMTCLCRFRTIAAKPCNWTRRCCGLRIEIWSEKFTGTGRQQECGAEERDKGQDINRPNKNVLRYGIPPAFPSCSSL